MSQKVVVRVGDEALALDGRAAVIVAMICARWPLIEAVNSGKLVFNLRGNSIIEAHEWQFAATVVEDHTRAA